MITDPQGTVLALFAAFCRVGGCFMLLPGFSSARVSMQIRLFLAVAVSMAVLPILWDTIYPKAQGSTVSYIQMIFFETLTGAVIGLITRYYVLGLQFAGTSLTNQWTSSISIHRSTRKRRTTSYSVSTVPTQLLRSRRSRTPGTGIR